MSVNAAKQTIDHNYQSAVGQSGINAGVDGFDIQVKGNTDLKGAAITSSADKPKNSLQTASLTYSDLENKQDTSASSYSISLGNSTSVLAQVGTNLMANLAGQVGLPENASEHSSTQSVISPATVTITGTGDTEKDKQSLANSQANAETLTSRDASSANQSLKNTLTLQDAAKLQQDLKTAQQNQQAAKLVGEVMDNMIGDVAATKGWKEGSTEKVLLHGLSGAIQASIAGGSLAAGAAAGAVNEKLIPVMVDYLEKNGGPQYVKDEKGNTIKNPQFADLMKIGSTLLGAGVGAAVGGGSASNVALGASVGLTGTTYNFLSHQARDQLNALRSKKNLSSDEKRQLAMLEITDQSSDALLAKYRSGAPLNDTERSNLNVYLGMYQQDMQAYYGKQLPAGQATQMANKDTQNLLNNGSPTANNYSYPYAADSATQTAYMDKLRSSQGIFASAPDSANRDLFNQAKRDTGMGGELFGGVIPNDAYLPSAMQNSGTNTTLDALRNSPVLATGGYLIATGTGASEQTKQNVATTLSQLSDIGASFVLPRASVSPVVGTTVAVPGPSVSNPVQKGGTVELFTNESGAKVPEAVTVGPTDPHTVAADARNMPSIPSNSQAMVVANNPFIPPKNGSTFSMMDYLPEATRITQPGGEIVINGTAANKYLTNMPTPAQLDALGLEVKYQGPLLPEYQGHTFLRTDGSPLTDPMRSIVFVKKK